MNNLSFNSNKTWAFLMGNWEFEEHSQLPNLPSVEKNIESLMGVLSDPLILEIPKDQIISVKNQSDILQTFIAKFPKPVETLIVYYAGHGLCDGKNLFLALPNSLYQDSDTGLEFETLWKKILNKASNIILILDCCHSGKAFNAINKQDGRNIVVLTATDKTNLASSPKNWQNTAFTQHLIDLLNKGIRNHQPFLTLKDLATVLKETLPSQGFPKPSENEFLDISPFHCFHNLGFKTFYVPRSKNEYFTGREEILKELHKKLKQDQVVALNQKAPTIAVHGLGGIGKTQTLIEYAYRCRDQSIYQTILWLSADSKESFESGFQTLATELGFNIEGKSFEEIKKSVENWFLTHKEWLLLIDNADELEIIRTFLSKVKGQGQILISTRAQNTRPFAEPLALEKMTEQEAFEFLEKRTGLFIDDHAKELAKTLDYLPLALDQAAAYIQGGKSF